jgi:hypothetical protein
MEAGQTDERLELISAYVQKTLKLKAEKWTKMMAQVTDFFKIYILKTVGFELLNRQCSYFLDLYHFRLSSFGLAELHVH